ncbi:hypothetical protein ACOMHN_007387 [Nucella lapillus]
MVLAVSDISIGQFLNYFYPPTPYTIILGRNTLHHFQLISRPILWQYLNFFYPTPYTIILGRNDKTVERLSPDACAKRCLLERDFVCRSFDYQIRNGSCLLSSTTGSDVGQLYYQGQAQAHHFELKPFLDCGGVLNEEKGLFASPNWPRDYEHNVNCTWRVITFVFTHFQLGPRNSNNPCDASNDRLVVTDMTSRGVMTFCATSPMTSYTSRSNEVTLQLLTNAALDAAGFIVSYTADWPCKSSLTADSGQLASPSWPLQYPPLVDCRWTIRAPPYARVLLHFTSVDLDAQNFGVCASDHYDVIEIFEGESATAKLLGRLCGRGSSVTSFTSQGHVMLVTFRSDSHVQRTGFHASYRFLFLSSTSSSSSSTTTAAATASIAASASSSPREDKQGVDLMTPLTAHFIEPPRDVISRWRFSTAVEGRRSSTPSYPLVADDDSGQYMGPVLRTNSAVSETFVRTMWTLVVCLVLLLLLVLAILVFVWRHYRRRSPKRRNVPNYTFTEEELSLYEKDTHRESDPEITFSNPLYESRYPHPSSRLASRTTSITTMTSLSRC